MKLYIPFSYLLLTRIKTKHERISWFIIYPAFLIIATLLFNGDLLNFMLTFCMTMSLYEIGYLDNDFRTVKKEKNPTVRADEQRSWIEHNLQYLIGIRLLIALLVVFYIIPSIDFIQKSIFIFLLCLLAFGFYFHNTLRSRWNVLTYFIVVLCRYLIPVVVAVKSEFYGYLIPFIIIAFPLVRTIEHACKEKYELRRIKLLVRNPDNFRVKWYAGITLLLLIFIVFYENEIVFRLVLLSVYFLLYRMMTFYFSRSKNILRNKHSSYKWDENEK